MKVDSVHGRIYADQLPRFDAVAAALGLPTSPAYKLAQQEKQKPKK